jgi:phenylalanyl-tRNA synthetase beta chain
VTAFDAKADVLAMLEALGFDASNVPVTADAPAWFHPGRSGSLRLGPTVLATFGEFHPAVLEKLDVTGPAAGFELILDAIPLAKTKATKTKPALTLSDLQPVKRDFAFAVDRAVTAAAMLKAVRGADRALVRAVNVFDVFEGAALGAGRKSVAIEVTLQPTDRTLTEEDIAKVSEKIVAEVAKATGATLRE